MELQERFDRLDRFIDEGRLVRSRWAGVDGEGRETACLLAALSPEVGELEVASACPAEVMPGWLARLTPWIDDTGSLAAWPEVVGRFGAAIRRPRSAEAWYRLEYAVRALCVREAMRHTNSESVLAVCRVSARLCECLAAGGERDSELFSAVQKAAYAHAAAYAAHAAAYAANAAHAAAYAAYAAAYAANAADAAHAAAAAANAAAYAANAANAADAERAATDRIIDGILSLLEAA